MRERTCSSSQLCLQLTHAAHTQINGLKATWHRIQGRNRPHFPGEPIPEVSYPNHREQLGSFQLTLRFELGCLQVRPHCYSSTLLHLYSEREERVEEVEIATRTICVAM